MYRQNKNHYRNVPIIAMRTTWKFNIGNKPGAKRPN